MGCLNLIVIDEIVSSKHLCVSHLTLLGMNVPCYYIAAVLQLLSECSRSV